MQVPGLGAIDGGLEMRGGPVVMGPETDEGKMWAGRPIVWD